MAVTKTVLELVGLRIGEELARADHIDLDWAKWNAERAKGSGRRGKSSEKVRTSAKGEGGRDVIDQLPRDQSGRFSQVDVKKVVGELQRSGFKRTKTSVNPKTRRSYSEYRKGDKTITITRYGSGTRARFGVQGILG